MKHVCGIFSASPIDGADCVECIARRASNKLAAEQRVRPHVHCGVDLRAEARRYCRELGIKLPRKLDFKRSATRLWHGRGGRHRVMVGIGVHSTISDICEVLLHELCHAAVPGAGHSEAFISRLVRAARALWGVEVKDWATIERGNERVRAYAVDRIIMAELAARVEAGLVVFTAAKDPVVKPEVQVPLVERRAEHARKMLERNERQLAAAQKRVSKWRRKVSYYDRVAAKSGGRA